MFKSRKEIFKLQKQVIKLEKELFYKEKKIYEMELIMNKKNKIKPARVFAPKGSDLRNVEFYTDVTNKRKNK